MLKVHEEKRKKVEVNKRVQEDIETGFMSFLRHLYKHHQTKYIQSI
jgi:hypothetical protein